MNIKKPPAASLCTIGSHYRLPRGTAHIIMCTEMHTDMYIHTYFDMYTKYTAYCSGRANNAGLSRMSRTTSAYGYAHVNAHGRMRRDVIPHSVCQQPTLAEERVRTSPGTHAHTYVCTHMSVYMSTHTCLHTCPYMSIHMSTHMSIHMSIPMSTHLSRCAAPHA